jgi:hypothetical protein
MLYCTDPNFKSLFAFDKLSYWKIRFLSGFTSFDEKQHIIRIIEDKSRKLALEKRLDCVIYILFYRIEGPEIAHVIPLDCAINQAIDIRLNSDYVRSPEKLLLVMTFHEYCHFLYYLFTPEILKKIETFYSEHKIPNWRNDVKEAFCDLFGYYVVDKSTGDPDLDRFIEEIITFTNHELKNSRMWKASEMPDHYHNIDWRI